MSADPERLNIIWVPSVSLNGSEALKQQTGSNIHWEHWRAAPFTFVAMTLHTKIKTAIMLLSNMIFFFEKYCRKTFGSNDRKIESSACLSMLQKKKKYFEIWNLVSPMKKLFIPFLAILKTDACYMYANRDVSSTNWQPYFSCIYSAVVSIVVLVCVCKEVCW